MNSIIYPINKMTIQNSNYKNISEKILWLFDTYNIIVKSSEETGGKYILIEGYFKPHSLIPLHLHKTIDEFFLVLDGKVEVQYGNKKMVANEGDELLVKKGTPHSLRNINNDMSKLICLINQGWFQNFFMEAGTEVPDIFSEPKRKITHDDIRNISRKYDTELL
ncbi:MAG: cupin domain-containing protein [Nitrososphaeraceae archaeon]|nr:cupin domain-containing protein [Nitrososphaeraceae archaeon]